ncbi:MAG: ribonuclease P protein component [Spirochaetales bacterium]|uniref:Ribonuclease P protein component n=1 Tax=Candidatus Thalassospirochaeta sargassi TaxID=3119039 RepID=A0AAJ1IBH4_9SPIO|nr:ribonuclease P protein component [Spirochaetales bacterium]
MRRSLTKSERLGKLSDIKRTFASGKRFSAPGAKLVFKTNELEYSRFMVTLVRNYGNSIQRNRAKRIGKEVFRLNKHRIKPGFDIVMVFFPNEDNYLPRETQMLKLLKKAGLYSSGGTQD